MLKLYDYFRSSASYRVRIALNLKKVPFETIPIHLIQNGGEQHEASYDAINPAHLVPSLQTGDDVISQSFAIMEYLEERYPEPKLWPKNILQRAKAREFALAIVADLHPLNNLRVLQYLRDELLCSESQKDAWYQHWIHTGLKSLETILARRVQASLFAFDETPGIADICLIPQLYNARRFSCDLSAYPKLLAIESSCVDIKAFVEAYPKEPATQV